MTAKRRITRRTQCLPIVIALCLEFQSAQCSGQEKRARQKLLVRVPAVVQLTASTQPGISDIDIRVDSSSDVAVTLSTESSVSTAASRVNPVLILQRGHRCVVRLSYDAPPMLRKEDSTEEFVHHQIPPGDKPVLTISAL